MILGVDGISDFNALHSGKHNEEVELCAFDLLAMDGDDLRDLPPSMRKANLARLLARRPYGIFLNDFEQIISPGPEISNPPQLPRRIKAFANGRVLQLRGDMNMLLSGEFGSGL